MTTGNSYHCSAAVVVAYAQQWYCCTPTAAYLGQAADELLLLPVSLHTSRLRQCLQLPVAQAFEILRRYRHAAPCFSLST